MKKTWFISDLHLDPSRPHLFTLLHEFLDRIEDQAEALYILGDLFEFWIGDDIIDSPLGVSYLPVIKHLRKLSDSGIKLYFIQGNRDFFVRDKLINNMGATLLADTHVIDLYGTPTLILHGDTLCTDDKGYQLMRKVFRIKLLQFIYLSLSLESRATRTNKVRKVTHQQTQNKDCKILDVNQQEVEKLMKKNNVVQMIHGHTHRPDTHLFNLDRKEAKRLVLADWHDKASYIEASSEGLKLVY
jgi:UDP-2,3-diacylglucosamine hydrolase